MCNLTCGMCSGDMEMSFKEKIAEIKQNIARKKEERAEKKKKA